MKKLVLIDAYALIFRAYYALIRAPRVNSKGQNTSAVFGFVNTLQDILKTERPDYIAVAFDPAGGTFRHEAYPAYKAQREETPEDIRWAVPVIKDIIKAHNISIVEIAGFEADDVIGTLAWKGAEAGLEVEMITPDKDYAQLVREHVTMCRPGHGAAGMERLGVAEVCEKYGLHDSLQVIDLLGLMGDSADNIPGCPGVGEKTAVKLIQQFGSIEQLLASTDQLKGAQKKKVEENAEQIRFSKFLATIKTDVPLGDASCLDDATGEVNFETFATQEPDKLALRKIYEELEFRSFITRFLDGNATEGAATTLPAQRSQRKTKRNAASSEPNLFGNEPDLFRNEPDLFAGQSDLLAKKTEAGDDLQNFAKNGGNFDAKITTEGTGDDFQAILERLENVSHDYQLVDTKSAAEELCRRLLTFDTVAFDTETTSKDAIEAELVGMSFAVEGNRAWYVPVSRETKEADEFVKIFEPFFSSDKILKVGQNMKYDLTVLAAYGIEVSGPMFDTMLAHYVVQPELRHNMDYLAEIYLRYQTIHYDDLFERFKVNGPRGAVGKTMRDLDPAEIKDYACEDADVTLRLMPILAEEMEKNGVRSVFDTIEMPLMPVLARIERNGVVLDTNAIEETGTLFRERMEQLEREIYELAGEEFLLTSPRQVGVILFEKLKISDKVKKTKTGQYSTSEDILESLRAKHPIVGKILDHRGLKKLLSTYIDALPKLINPKTGHIHTSFNQAVTATGRLSSSNPNLQNIPVRGEDGKEIRKAFIPEPGCIFFSADYSQIELRIMAHLSGDESMIRDFRDGADIHAATAARVFKKSLDDITRDERRKAKTANFGIIYGISAFGLAERMEVSRSEAKELIENYFATYPRVKEYMNASIDRAREKGYIVTEFGRRRYLADINSHNATVRGYAERNAVNAPIQGTAADIIKLAMIAIDRRMREERLQSKMILQVHDELNFSALPDELPKLRAIVVEEMERAYTMQVPLVAECGEGTNWLESH